MFLSDHQTVFKRQSPLTPLKILKPEHIKDTVEIKIGSDYEELVFQLKQWKGKYFVDNGSRLLDQKATLQILLQDPEQDLYKLKFYGDLLAIFVPQGRPVYSRSGTDSVFPPLAVAFQKIDPTGPNVLWNTYLVTHPNTLHMLIPWDTAGEQMLKMRKLSDF